MKRLTFDGAWTKCLRQWRWIGRQIKAGDKRWIEDLKDAWLAENDHDAVLEAGCYFCAYASLFDGTCDHCPAKMVDQKFKCTRDEYNFWDNPLAFLRKLEQLNRKRLAMKKNRKGRTK